MTLDQEAIDNQFTLLATHRRTLAHLLQQAAQYGGAVFAPPHTANGIAEARAEIQRLKLVLRDAGVVVPDEPNDQQPPRRVGLLPQPRVERRADGDGRLGMFVLEHLGTAAQPGFECVEDTVARQARREEPAVEQHRVWPRQPSGVPRGTQRTM